jgi:hypothetical protein
MYIDIFQESTFGSTTFWLCYIVIVIVIVILSPSSIYHICNAAFVKIPWDGCSQCCVCISTTICIYAHDRVWVFFF